MASIYVIWKIGDQNIGEDNIGMKHGMPVSYTTVYDDISDHMKKCYGITEESIGLLDDIKATLLPNMVLDELDARPPEFRERNALLNFDDIRTETGIADIEDQWKSSGVVEPIDRTDKTSLLTISSDTLYPDTPDDNSISEGLYMFGPGGDYIDLATACADCTTQTDDLILMQIATFTATSTAPVRHNHGSRLFKITVGDDDWHKGNWNNGFKITASFTVLSLFIRGGSSPVFERLKIELTDVGQGISFGWGTESVPTVYIRDMMIKGAGAGSGQGIYRIDTNFTLNITNCIIWNFGSGFFGFSRDANNLSYNTIYNCDGRGLDNPDNSSCTITYNSVFNCTPCYNAATSSSTYIGNASSDSIGNIGLQNLVAATEFESLVETDGDSFLRPKEGNTTLDIAPAHTDIFGNESTYNGAKGAYISMSSQSSLSSESSFSSESSLSSLSSDSSVSSLSSESSITLNSGSSLDIGDIVDVSGGDVPVVSTITTGIMESIPAVAADPNFSSSAKWSKVVVIYRHANGQKMTLNHKYRNGQWTANGAFLADSNTGIWEKDRIIILDNMKDTLVIGRDEIGVEEDLTITV